MNAKLTDDAVAGLPLSHGRAELLEEIMSTPVNDDLPVRTEKPHRRSRWVVPSAAVAVVALVAVGSAWWAGGTGAPTDTGAPDETRTGGSDLIASQPGLVKSSEDVSYFLGRESLVPTARRGMAPWREKLFAWMSRNAQQAATFFNLPPDRVVELGVQVEL